MIKTTTVDHIHWLSSLFVFKIVFVTSIYLFNHHPRHHCLHYQFLRPASFSPFWRWFPWPDWRPRWSARRRRNTSDSSCSAGAHTSRRSSAGIWSWLGWWRSPCRGRTWTEGHRPRPTRSCTCRRLNHPEIKNANFRKCFFAKTC